MPTAKFGVDITGFKNGIKEGQATLKSLDAEMKVAEAAFKNTGNAEQLLANKTKTLTAQLNAQKAIMDQAQKAMKAMTDAGIAPTDQAYQKLNAQMLNAQAGMLETQAALNGLTGTQQQAASSADALTKSVNGIGKKISLDQVITGIGRITSGLESAAQKAAQLGKAIWENITDSASWADNVATQATIMGISTERYQQLQGVFDTIADITVQDWMNAKRKVQKAINDPSGDTPDILQALGIKTHETQAGKFGEVEGLAKDWETVFWEAAKALQQKVASGEISDDLADTWGEALFGKKFSNLKPLIKLGQEAFNAALDTQETVSDEAIEKLAELNDAYIKLQGDFEKLKAETLSGLAPALTTASNVLDSLLSNLMAYLQTPEGQQALQDMETAVSGLFEDLAEIDPDEAVASFKKVFDSIVEGLQWLTGHSGEVVGAMKGIVAGWAGLKLTGGALTILQLINGVRGLRGGGLANAVNGAAEGAGSGAAGGAAAGAAGGGLFSQLGTKFTTAITNFKNTVGAGALESMPFFGEWFMHNTHAGQELTNGGSIFDMFKTIGEDASQWWTDTQGRAGTFFSDWGKVFENIFSTMFGGADEEYLEFEEELRRRIIQDNLGESAPDTQAMIQEKLDAMKLTAQIEPEVPENAAEEISKHIGVVQIGARIVPVSFGGGAGGGGGGKYGYLAEHANGLPMVPWDGYLAMLHKGERVLTARENRSYTANSNLYVDRMYMNNGMDAAALAAAMKAQNQRISHGFGS